MCVCVCVYVCTHICVSVCILTCVHMVACACLHVVVYLLCCSLQLHTSVGASLGGMQSVCAASMYPDRVSRWVTLLWCS